MILDPFEGKTPNRILWVDPDAPPGGNGTEDWPINSIQRAVAKSHPGTAIMVKEGTYHENVYIMRTKDGTPESPIWLISADGPGKAHIIAPSKGMAAIGGGGVQNWVVDGFWTTGGKNGIHFGQNGYDYSDMTANIVVRNNFIENPVEDGVKMNGGDNMYVIGNTIVGGRDEGIDFVAVKDGIIAYNDVSGNTGTSAAIFAKFGSENIQIVNNYVHDNKAIGISLGGHVDAQLDPRAGTEHFQVSDITVSGNVVVNSGRTPLAAFGAHDAVVTGNYFEANTKYYTSLWIGPGNETKNGIAQSKNVDISGNVITEHRKGPRVAETSENVVIDNNTTDTAFVDQSGPAGLARYLAEKQANTDTQPATGPEDSSSGTDVDTPAQVVETPVKLPEAVPDAAPAAPPPIVAPAPPPIVTPAPPPSPVDPTIGTFRVMQLKEFLGEEWAQSAGANHAIKGGSGIGTAGHDAISGKAASYAGGKGDDSYTLNVNQAATIVEHADGGIDTLYTTGRNVTLIENVENLVLKSSNGAILTGNSGDNRITGNAGADFLIGNGGNNLLQGGKGTDRFVIGADDKLTRIVDLEAGESINIAGLQVASFAELKKQMVEVGGTTMIDLGDGRVVILDGVGVAELTAAQFSLDDGAAKGAAQSAGINGKKVAAHATQNTAFGTDGNDQIYGNGKAMMHGGAGDDRYFVQGDGDRVFEGANGGVDTVLLYSASYTMDAGVENVTTKSNLGVTIVGNGLANVIVGGDGNDRITGGVGADLLTGGSGSDVFVFTSLRDGGDVITDFTAGVDVIDLTALTARMPTASFRLDYSANGKSSLYATVDGIDHMLASVVWQGTAPTMDDLVI